MRKKYTFEVCQELVRKFDTVSQFRTAYPAAYNAAWHNNWIDIFYPDKWKPRNLSLSECQRIASQFNSISELRKADYTVYIKCLEYGILDTLFQRQRHIAYTNESFFSIAATCNSRKELAMRYPGAYDYGLRHNLIKQCGYPTAAQVRAKTCPPASVSDVLREAPKYRTRSEFQRACPALYKIACSNKLMDSLGFEDIGKVKSRALTRITDEEIIESSKKYGRLADFRKLNKRMYDNAYRRNLLALMPWLHKNTEVLTRKFADCIYAYEFPQTKTAYIGRTVSPKRRHAEHCMEGDSVFDYAKENGLSVPEPIYLHDNVSVKQGKILEGKEIDRYRKAGWKMLNKAKAGSIGSLGSSKLTKKFCLAESKKYNTLNDLIKNAPGLYRKLRVTGWLSICSWLTRELKQCPYAPSWSVCSDDIIISEARRYKSRTEFCTQSSGAYTIARKRKLLDIAFPDSITAKKAIGQFNADGKLIRTYESIEEASRILGVSAPGIGNTCRGIQHTCHGFRFKFLKGKPPLVRITSLRRRT